ncbi:MAG TPA: FAD-dependent oxidoreductase [Polyangiaceae bacterium]|jgi:NADPH-dependent 2,4-dienoyl-CoA reductase/sulfur reductase-like enzyme/pSer/pThr/pTyr-binding forkhead associated (FHA) protein
MARKRYLIIGDGAAGLTAAASLRHADAEAIIGVFSDEPVPGYYRAALTNYLLGELREDQLFAVPPDFYQRYGIHRIYTRVIGVDAARSAVWCSNSSEPTAYDQLLVASGARARAPSFEGAHLPGVLTLRTIADARRVYDAVRLHGLKTAVVLGGGALGLEWAHALLEHGVKVTLIERAPRFLPGALDEVASDLLAARLRKAGIDVLFNDEVRAVQPGPRGVAGVGLASGRSVACELVAAALGVVPNSEFLANTGLTLAANGALAVNSRLQSSVANIWAAGDVANVAGEWLALWEPARLQARAAAQNMRGGSALHQPGAHYFATRLFDLDFARIGQIERQPGSEELIDFPRGTGQIAYRKLVILDGKLKGALMIGERALRVRAIGRNMKRLIDAAVEVGEIKHRLLEPSFDVEAWLERKRLVERPAAPRKTTLFVEAKLKRTQALSLNSAAATGAMSEFSASPTGGTVALPSRAVPTQQSGRTTALPSGPLSAAAAGHTAALPSGPRQTRVLSIGLHAEAAPEARGSLAPIDARLELQGRTLPINLPVTNLGQAKECQIPLADPSLSAFHAQLVRYDAGLYLRDLGSSSGTWVNGQCLFGPHALRDGDRIRIGQLEMIFRSPALPRISLPDAQQKSLAGPRLEVRSGGALGLSFALGPQPVLVGSSPECSIRFTDPSVSPRHAELRSAGTTHALADLGSYGGSYVRGGRLAPQQPVALSEGDWLRFGAVDVLYTSAARADALASLRPSARLLVTSGSDSGKTASVGERLLVGSDPASGLVLTSVSGPQLELCTHNGRFWVRDLSGGRAFRAGSAISKEFSEIHHGDLILIGGTVMLHFEEGT